jgi:hypothetical protein
MHVFAYRTGSSGAGTLQGASTWSPITSPFLYTYCWSLHIAPIYNMYALMCNKRMICDTRTIRP